jgi:hypothetical protein
MSWAGKQLVIPYMRFFVKNVSEKPITRLEFSA